MKDFFSAFGSEFFRPLVTLMLPGAVAVLPGFVAVFLSVDAFRRFAEHNHAEIIGGFLLVCVFAGLVIEDWGSRLENYIDKVHAARDTGKLAWREALLPCNHSSGDSEGEWYAYLRLAFDTEPVGHRYLRTLVLRLKFELGCCIGCFFAISPVWFWPTTYMLRAAITLFLLMASAYFCWEASATVRLLERLRHELLKGIKVVAGQGAAASE